MDREKLKEYLLDSDGSTRDINFTPSDFEKTKKFVSLFFVQYPKGEISDQDGEEVEIDSVIIEKLFENKEGYLHGRFHTPGALIEHIQLFIDWSEESKCEIELSFFPSDLSNEFTLDKFFKLVNQWWETLESEEVFIRYENASWDYYDPKGLGVFYHQKRHNNGN